MFTFLQPSLLILKDRLYNAIDSSVAHSYGINKPENPFKPTKQQINTKTQARTGSSSSTSMIPPSSPAKPQTYQPPSIFQAPQNNFQPPMTQNAFQSSVSQNNFQQSVPLNNLQSSVPQFFQPPAVPSQPNFTSAPIVKPAQPPLVNSQSNLFTPSNQTSTQPVMSNQQTLSYQEVRPATAWNDPPIVQPKVKAPVVPKDVGIDQSKLFQPTNFSVPNYGQPLIGNFPTTSSNPQTQLPSNGFNNPVTNNNINYFNPVNNRQNVPANIGFNPIQNSNTSISSGTNSPVQKASVPTNEKPVKQPLPSEYQNITRRTKDE